MLEAQRAIGKQPIESGAIELAGHRLVVTDRANPRSGFPWCRPKPSFELGGGSDLGRPRLDGTGRRRPRPQVDVVVVKPRQDHATMAIDHVVSSLLEKPRRDLEDPVAHDPEVDLWGPILGVGSPWRRPHVVHDDPSDQDSHGS